MPSSLFKNWRVIATIEDNNLRLALSTLEVNSDIGRRMMTQLPEYFTTERQAGPFSLAAMRQKAQKNGRRHRGLSQAGDHINSYDAVPEGLPVFGFAIDPGEEDRLVPVPADIKSQLTHAIKQGSSVRWNDKFFVVIELSDYELWIAPAELVRVDI